MIDVTKIGDLTFQVRIDEKIRQDLRDVSGWGSEEDAIGRILSDILLGVPPYEEWESELPDDKDI